MGETVVERMGKKQLKKWPKKRGKSGRKNDSKWMKSGPKKTV